MERAYGLDIPRTLEEALSPERTALIVYDMQVGILRQLPHAQNVIGKVQRVLTSARNAGMRVFFMRHLSLPKEVAGVFQLQMAMRWQRTTRVEDVTPWFSRDSPGFPVISELEPRASEGVFDKITMSAFEGTPLNLALRDCTVNSFVVVGVATEYDDVPGSVHDLLANTLQDLIGTVARFMGEAVSLGQLRPEADADEVAWQLFGIYAAHHTQARLLRDPDADARAHRALDNLLSPLRPDDAP